MSPIDLDEFRPNRFIIHNEKVRPYLRGEGEREGTFFLLQSWRREGWIARIRMAGFNVRTLQDRIDALHATPEGIVLGDEVFRPLGTQREQIAAWDADRLRWRDLPAQDANGKRGVMLRVGEAIRRRKSRSGGDYFVVFAEGRGQAGLRPVGERDAVLHAYGAMAASGRPATFRYERTDTGYFVPSDQALIPRRHHEALDLLATEETSSWTFAHDVSAMVEQVLDTLAVRLEPMADHRPPTTDHRPPHDS